jgi:DNA repair photolyase
LEIKSTPGLQNDKIAVTISAPVDQIHKAIDLVSSEVGDKFASLEKHLERKTSKGWAIIKIKNETGEKVDAVAPLIISASRRNDTPARHSEWFMEGLKRDYVRMSEKSYVSFEKARLIVFWTKNPEPIRKHLGEIDKKEIGYYFQYTLNDYEAEGLEPNIPSLENRITTFKKLSERIGPKKVIWRFDPLVLTDTITKERLVEKIENLMEKLTGYTEKLVISFFKSGEYDHAQERIEQNNNQKDFESEDIAFVAAQLEKLGKKYNMKVATCAEKEELSRYKIDHNKCIDDDLIKRVFKDDKILMSFLNSKKSLKHGLREEEGCECIVSQEIGSNNTCANGCLYCYANKSDKSLEKNLELIKKGEIGEFLKPRSPKKYKN